MADLKALDERSREVLAQIRKLSRELALIRQEMRKLRSPASPSPNPPISS
jgi:hypothetical protein